MKTNILKDDELNKQLLQYGYVVMNGIDSNAIQELLQCYETSLPESEIGGFQSTHFYKDLSYKQRVQETILKVFNSFVLQQFDEYVPYFGNFMVKESGPASEMPLHADWTYVDESKFVSLGLWCPLVDTNANNGRLGVVPYSHLIPANYRGPQIKNAIRQQNKYLEEQYGKFLNIKAGQVVVYNHRTLHFSLPNNSDGKRVALNLVCIPKKAKIVHYARLNEDDVVSVFEPRDASFFLNYSLFEAPKEAPVSTRPYIELQHGKAELDSILKKNWWSKLISIFNKTST